MHVYEKYCSFIPNVLVIKLLTIFTVIFVEHTNYNLLSCY